MLQVNDPSKSTRDRVLQTLLANQRCTINELADAVDINPISVRHHINRLQADGLVNSIEERHGVGRPRRYYYLTENGREQFPTHYIRLAMRLIEQLKGTLPPQMINKIFTQMAQDLTADHQERIENLSIEQRLDLIKELLTGEGFGVEWERKGDQIQIHETMCPYFHIGQNHPEVCSVDQTLISTVLAVPAEKVKCMLHGDSQCTYIISNINIPVLEKTK